MPTESAQDRIRSIVSNFDLIWKAMEGAKKAPIDHQTWNRRYRDYMERIQTGEALEVGIVLASLLRLQADKDLSFGERKLLDYTKTLLSKELAACEGITELQAEQKIADFFNGAQKITHLKLVKNS